MRASELVEVAALAARHAPALLASAGGPPTDAVERYWTAAKFRLDRWMQAIKRFRDTEARASPAARKARWQTARPTLEEILASDVLARVWTGVATTADARRGSVEIQPVVHSALAGHMEARQRALALLVETAWLPRRDVGELNQLRRRAERWTDFLLGSLADATDVADVAQFAFDRDRALQFAADRREQRPHRHDDEAWSLSIASLKAAFRYMTLPGAANPDLNDQIAAAVIACLPGEALEPTSLMRSLWLSRLAHACADMEGLVASALWDARIADVPGRGPVGRNGL
jgi:hypothetical protein